MLLTNLQLVEKNALENYQNQLFPECIDNLNYLLKHGDYDNYQQIVLWESMRYEAVQHVKHTLSTYPHEIVDAIVKRSRSTTENEKKGGVTFVILSCKRYDLFTRTMNSFLSHCKDIHLVTQWICIDDNSHPNEKEAMKVLYPFFEFVFKNSDEKGEEKSLNIAQKKSKGTYILFMEDDWLFVETQSYISSCMRILKEEDECVQQVLFNRHYIEIPDEAYLRLQGGVRKVDSCGKQYILHEYFPEGSQEYELYRRRYYWNFSHQPYFAVRPSLMRRTVWDQLGPFIEDTNYTFENEYGERYLKKGFKSAYLQTIACYHIGRLNREKTNVNSTPNAYQLNGVKQYGQDWFNVNVQAVSHESSSIVLAVTTCKRLATFTKSIKTLLCMLTDIASISSFVIVDDNSSADDLHAMKTMLPFFHFIEKTLSQKGHAKSINLLMNYAYTHEYDYLLHTEDDWNFCQPFQVKNAIKLIQEKSMDQVLLVSHPHCQSIKTQYQNIEYNIHEHDYNDTAIPSFFQQWRENSKIHKRPVDNKGCWWPGYSLNPHVVSLKRMKVLGEQCNEQIDPTYFEYDFSLRLWSRGFKVCFLHTAILQYQDVTAYVLNDERRLFDSLGCSIHRITGGSSSCSACIQQK